MSTISKHYITEVDPKQMTEENLKDLATIKVLKKVPGTFNAFLGKLTSEEVESIKNKSYILGVKQFP